MATLDAVEGLDRVLNLQPRGSEGAATRYPSS